MDKPRSSLALGKVQEKTVKLSGTTSRASLAKKSLNMSQRPADPSPGYYVSKDLQKRIKKIRNIQRDYKSTSKEIDQMYNSKTAKNLQSEETPTAKGGGPFAKVNQVPYESQLIKLRGLHSKEASTSPMNLNLQNINVNAQNKINRAALNSKIKVKLLKQKDLIKAPVFFTDIMDMGDRIYTPYPADSAQDSLRDANDAYNVNSATDRLNKASSLKLLMAVPNSEFS